MHPFGFETGLCLSHIVMTVVDRVFMARESSAEVRGRLRGPSAGVQKVEPSLADSLPSLPPSTLFLTWRLSFSLLS